MGDVWIRRYNGWAPSTEDNNGFAWALWQPTYVASPWPTDELKPGFVYYVCEETKTGRAITAKATVEDVLAPTEVSSAEDAYLLVQEDLFTDDFTIDEEAWHANPYNRAKAAAPWPQVVTAWRTVTNPVGPHVLKELSQFPRTGWMHTDKIAL